MEITDNEEVDGQLNVPTTFGESESFVEEAADTARDKDDVKETSGYQSHGESKDNLEDKTDEHPFSKKTWREDLTMVVEGKQLHVSKTILEMFCQRFSKMFDETSIDTLTLSDKTFESILEFLLCVYPNIQKPITIENVQVVMPLALEYEADQLVAECEDCIRKNVHKSTPHSILMRLLKLCRKNSLDNLEKLCWKTIREMDISNIEELEAEDADEDIARKIVDIKIESLKASSAERDSLKDAFQYMLLGAGDKEKAEMESVVGGSFGKLHLLFPIPIRHSMKSVKQQTNGIYTFSISGDYNVIYVSVKREQGLESMIKGRIILINRVNPKNNNVIPFCEKLSAYQNSFDIPVCKEETIHTESNGFIVQSQGEIEVHYISKSEPQNY